MTKIGGGSLRLGHLIDYELVSSARSTINDGRLCAARFT
jgi:hypothetical protein